MNLGQLNDQLQDHFLKTITSFAKSSKSMKYNNRSNVKSSTIHTMAANQHHIEGNTHQSIQTKKTDENKTEMQTITSNEVPPPNNENSLVEATKCLICQEDFAAQHHNYSKSRINDHVNKQEILSFLS